MKENMYEPFNKGKESKGRYWTGILVGLGLGIVAGIAYCPSTVNSLSYHKVEDVMKQADELNKVMEREGLSHQEAVKKLSLEKRVKE